MFPTKNGLIRGDEMDKEVIRIFEQIKYECRPDKDVSISETIFNIFFVTEPKQETNFIGGINDDRNTLHENLFQAMWGDSVKPQVHFGTGKGGYEKYLSKRYTADFYDEERNVIYEIDGDNHKSEVQKIKDRIRDYFFLHELGIRTIRITNEMVEEMLLSELERKYKSGEYDELFNRFK